MRSMSLCHKAAVRTPSYRRELPLSEVDLTRAMTEACALASDDPRGGSCRRGDFDLTHTTVLRAELALA